MSDENNSEETIKSFTKIGKMLKAFAIFITGIAAVYIALQSLKVSTVETKADVSYSTLVAKLEAITQEVSYLRGRVDGMASMSIMSHMPIHESTEGSIKSISKSPKAGTSRPKLPPELATFEPTKISSIVDIKEIETLEQTQVKNLDDPYRKLPASLDKLMEVRQQIILPKRQQIRSQQEE